MSRCDSSSFVPYLIPLSLVASGFVYWKVNAFHVLGLLSLPVVALMLSRRPSVLRDSWFLFFAGTFLFYVSSLWWVKDEGLALGYVARMANGLFLVLLLFLSLRDQAEVQRLLLKVKLVFWVILGIGFLETYSILRWPISRFSAFNEVFGIDRKYLVYMEKLENYRLQLPEAYDFVMSQPTVFYWEPNRFSLVLILLLPFAFVAGKRVWGRGIMLGLSGYLLLMAASRAAIFSFLISTAMMCSMLLLSKRVSWSHLMRVFASALLVTVSSLMIYGRWKGDTWLDFDRRSKIRSTFNVVGYYMGESGADSSSLKRLDLMKKGFQAFRDSPWVGVGAGNSLQKSKALFGDTNLHNFWLEILVEGGLIYALFCLFYIVLVMRILVTFKSQDERESDFWIAVCASLAASVPGVLAVGTPIYLLPFWFVVGMAFVFCSLRTNAA